MYYGPGPTRVGPDESELFLQLEPVYQPTTHQLLSLPTLISNPKPLGHDQPHPSTHATTAHISCPSRERSFSITSQNSNPRIASGHTGR